NFFITKKLLEDSNLFLDFSPRLDLDECCSLERPIQKLYSRVIFKIINCRKESWIRVTSFLSGPNNQIYSYGQIFYLAPYQKHNFVKLNTLKDLDFEYLSPYFVSKKSKLVKFEFLSHKKDFIFTHNNCYILLRGLL